MIAVDTNVILRFLTREPDKSHLSRFGRDSQSFTRIGSRKVIAPTGCELLDKTPGGALSM